MLPEKRHEKHFLPLSLEAQLSCGNAKAPKPRAPVPPNHQPLPPEFHAATFDFSIPTSADDAPPDGESFSQETDFLLDFQNACDLPGRAPPPPPKDLGREGCAKGGDGRPESPPPCSSQGTRASQAVPTEEHGGEARQDPPSNDPPEDDMSVDDVEAANVKERPKRHICRPQLYQSDEMERMEKEKRKAT